MPTPAEIALAEDYRLRQCPRKACTKKLPTKSETLSTVLFDNIVFEIFDAASQAPMIFHSKGLSFKSARPPDTNK